MYATAPAGNWHVQTSNIAPSEIPDAAIPTRPASSRERRAAVRSGRPRPRRARPPRDHAAPSDGEHLDVATGAPLIVMSGGNVGQHGRRIAQVAHRIRGDRAALVVDFRGRG
jgi:hypothetical protein